MISIKNLSLKYTKEFYALCSVSMEVKDGEKIALLGEEMSGKTSLLRVLSKLEEYNEGEIYVKNISLKKIDFKNDISMGYVPATPVFMEKKSVYENLKYVLKFSDLTEYEIETKINDALLKFGLEKIRNEKVKNISLFDKYVISFIRLMFRKLELVLIDNIFDNVNEDEKNKLIEIAKTLFKENENITCLVAATDETVATQLCDSSIKFSYGSIVK
ncbi:MAG: ATP-binding cassette domain-containing protein [Clostridia bacterium]